MLEAEREPGPHVCSLAIDPQAAFVAGMNPVQFAGVEVGYVIEDRDRIVQDRPLRHFGESLQKGAVAAPDVITLMYGISALRLCDLDKALVTSAQHFCQ